jgi:DNA-binding NarL/FixJ family response regulator
MQLTFIAEPAGPLAESSVTMATSTGSSAQKRTPPITRRRIIVADDHKIFRECLTRILGEVSGFDVIAIAWDGRQAVDLALKLHPDIVIMDVSMPHMNGIEATRIITNALPEIRVFGLSMHDEQEIEAQMIAAGASGFYPKDGPVEKLITALNF